MISLADQPIYKVDERPPGLLLGLVGLQYIVKMGLLIILPLWIMKTAHASWSQTINFVSLSLISGALSTFLVSLRQPLGANCFLPSIASVSYFAALLFIAQHFDAGHVLSAAFIISVSQIVISFLFYWIKPILNKSFAGLILFSHGIWAATLGVSEFFHPLGLGQVVIHGLATHTFIQPKDALLGMIVLAILLACLFSRRLRPICFLISMVFGWIIGALLGVARVDVQHSLQKVSWWHFPHLTFALNWHFSVVQVIALIVVGIYAALVNFSLMTTIAHENYSDWQKKCVSASVRVNVLTGFVAAVTALCGGYPATPIPGSLGDMIATGTYSRWIAWVFSVMLLLLAFIPKLFLGLLNIPAAVNGAAIIVMGAVLTMKGLYLVDFSVLSSKRVKIYAYGILFVVMGEISPYIYHIPFANYFTNNSLVIGLAVMLVLSILYFIKRDYVAEK